MSLVVIQWQQHMKMKIILTGLFVIFCFNSALKAQIPTNGLIAFYPFNGNANDESGNGNNGTIEGAIPTIDQCGNANSAYEFDSLTSDIIVKNSEILNNIDHVSLCGWIKPISFRGIGDNSIIDKGYYSHDDPFFQYHLGITGDKHPNVPASFVFAISLNNDYTYVVSPEGTWSPGNWYFVAGTYDGDSLKLYVNGVRLASLFKAGAINRFGQDIHIGKIKNYANAFTPGVMDDIRIYNRALTSEEIISLYNATCQVGKITGESEVCQGQQDVNYVVQPLEGATGYAWNYSGTGATVTGSSNSIGIDFSDNATGGNLSVTITGSSIGTQSTSIPITVNSIPSQAGSITGNNEVCVDQTGLSYAIPIIDYATQYNWNYSGTGATIHGNSNNIVMDFSHNATGGNLTVTGNNNCGDGLVSAPFSVMVNAIPSDAGIISGENVVCQNQKGVSYSVATIQNAANYSWNYNGSGATITGSSNSIFIDFADKATGGNLTVTGQNNCGNGVKSADFVVTVNSCGEIPSDINIPNSFSPNGDGINDYFVIRDIPENSNLIIFSRSGEKLYESTNYQNDWDGRDNEGRVLESDTYWYVFILSDSPSTYKGFVYLKR